MIRNIGDIIKSAYNGDKITKEEESKMFFYLDTFLIQ